MDSLPFTNAPVDDADTRAQNDKPEEAVPDEAVEDRNSQRGAVDEEEPLSLASFLWIASLPAHIRPHALARTFPRIVNRLADVWQDQAQYASYLDELVWDKRGGRRGFPALVAAEVSSLKAHFTSTAASASFDVWGTCIDAE